MKITKAKLKQIIKEELQVILTNEEVEEMFGEEVRAQVEAMESKEITKEAIMEEIQSDPEMLEAIEKLTDSIESLDVSIDFLSAAFTGESGVSIGAAQKQLGRAYKPKTRVAREPVKESEQFRDQQKMDAAQDVAGQEMSFEKWVAVVFQKGAQIDDNSPNPYDAWMSGQSPEEYTSSLNERKLTDPEKEKKEKIVRGMKDSEDELIKRYGKDAKNVMYATATKIAKDKK
jgi:predicted RND superfamily exporter protein